MNRRPNENGPAFDAASALMGRGVRVYRQGVDQRRTGVVVGYTRHPYAVRVLVDGWGIVEEVMLSDLVEV